MDTKEGTVPVRDLLRESMLERAERILKNPYDPTLLAELIREGTKGKSKWSSSGLRWLKKLLRRSLSLSLVRAATPVAGEVEKRRRAWENGNVERRSTPEKLHHYLKIRFEWNKRNGKVKGGEFTLSVEDLEWLFWEVKVDDPRRGGKGRKVTMSELDRCVQLMRVDTSGDFCLDNLKAIYRPKRRETGRKFKKTWNKGKVLWNNCDRG